MKKISIILILAVLVTSCKKENLSDFQEDILGEWELVRTIGFPGVTNYAPGNGNIVWLDESGGYESRKFDSVLTRATYRLKKKADCYSDEKIVMITLDGGGYYQRVELKNDTLSFGTSSCLVDGGSAIYQRL